ncbi:MAG TPA: FtsX-like permease family protein, partial [Mycobacteriales bacterium]|nr:FtsX-like permease family protein [Mycobacteriales bacterium]
STASTRAALRIARRSALRNKGRSALILAMVGVPVFTLVLASVIVRTAEPSNAEKTIRRIGTADARVERVATGPVTQDEYGGYTVAPGTSGDPGAPVAAADALRLLPNGSAVTPHGHPGEARVKTPRATAPVDWLEIDLADRLTDGLVRDVTGRLPQRPGEVLVTPALLARTGAELGGTLQLVDPKRTVTVVGTARLPDDTKGRAVIALPGELRQDWRFNRFLVRLRDGSDVNAVRSSLTRQGWHVTARSALLDPPEVDGGLAAEQVGVALVVAGLAAMEVILLAGAAFAVGARRQRRELGLIAATGGDRSHVRGVVLGGGVVVGVTAAIVGVLAGIGGAALVAPWLERRVSNQLFGRLDVRLTEVGGAALLGLVTAMLAAVLPARTAARQPVVDALTGRRGIVRSPVRLTVVGVVAIAAGAFIAAKGAATPVRFNQILAGAVVAELGFVACSPALVGAAGRLARFLPLPLRLAVRDSARHRTRSGPAVAAVMAALAGAIAMSVYLASDTERQRQDYRPRARPGQALLSTDWRADIVDAVAAELPVRKQVRQDLVSPTCTLDTCTGVDANATAERRTDEVVECLEQSGNVCFRVEQAWSAVAVADTSTLEVLTGPVPTSAARAFDRGTALVLDRRLVQDGHVMIEVRDVGTPRSPGNGGIEAAAGASSEPTPALVRLPAIVVGSGVGLENGNVIVSRQTAEKNGWRTAPRSWLLDLSRTPTAAERDRAEAVLLREDHQWDNGLYIERGFRSDRGIALLALLGAAALVALGASVIATGLAAADGRPDLATLSAVGASPRVRRVLAMSQAATIAFLGSVLGVLAGLVPAIAVINARTDFPLVIPWATLTLVVVAIPTVIAALAGIFTRSRLPLERRLA